MTWLTSLALGVLSAIVAGFGALGFGLLYVQWFRVSSREGNSGYLVIFFTLIGAVMGLLLGVVLARVVAAGTQPSFLKGLGAVLGGTVGLLAIIVLVAWWLADLPTKWHGHPVVMHAEVRCPAGFTVPSDAIAVDWYAYLDTRTRRVTSRGDLRLAEAREESGRLVLPMTLELDTSVREKRLYVRFAAATELFMPVFPSRPRQRHLVWSDWQDGGSTAGQPRLEPALRFQFRFRLEEVLPEVIALEEPTGPSADELQLQQTSAEQAEFDALTPDSPFESSLKWTSHTQVEERRIKAGAIIACRAELVTELSREILSPDAALADRALRALPFIKPLPPELAAAVNQVGDRVLASLDAFNATNPADDPRFQAAADASVAFSSWFPAHRALHDHAQVDGLPRLTAVLERAIVRSDSHVINSDIARVARHYVGEWTAARAAAK